MSLKHAASGEVVSVAPLGEALHSSRSATLVKSDDLEVNRLVLRAGTTLREHHVPGEITVQCLEGAIEFDAHGRSRVLRPGDLVHLAGHQPHALHALIDSSVLLTIVLKSNDASKRTNPA